MIRTAQDAVFGDSEKVADVSASFIRSAAALSGGRAHLPLFMIGQSMGAVQMFYALSTWQGVTKRSCRDINEGLVVCSTWNIDQALDNTKRICV